MPTTRPTPQSDQAGQADREVYAGVDTHAGTHHAAVVDSLGRHLGDHEFITSAAGIAALYAFICSFGTLIRVGVEGTASYGATLTTYLRDQSVGPDPRVVDTLTPAMRRERKVVFHHAPEDLLGAVQT